MLHRAPRLLFVALLPTLVVAEVSVVYEDDFENGLDGWDVRAIVLEMSDDVYRFNPDGTNTDPEGDDLYGPQVDAPDTYTMGYSWQIVTSDRTWAQWLQKQFPDAVAPGTHDVRVTADLYVYTPHGDPWAVGNRIHVLTDSLYDNYEWDARQDPGDEGLRWTYWPKRIGDDPEEVDNNGIWLHDVVLEGQLSTDTGDIEVRIGVRDKWGGPPMSVAWDDVKVEVGGVVLVDEDWESPDDIAEWEQGVWPDISNDTPQIFASDDPLLYDNLDNPGSQSGGYSSNIYPDPTDSGMKDSSDFQWLEKTFTGLVPPDSEITVKLEFDWFVYKDPEWRAPTEPDPWAVGNKGFLLTDDKIGDMTELFYNLPSPGFSVERWPGRIGETTDWSNNGRWLHHSVDRDITTETGDFQIRLLKREKYAGGEAVAWDNFVFRIVTPCNQPRYDMDQDQDVDQMDLARFQLCFTGADDPTGIYDRDTCRCMNSDGDEDIDAADFAPFQACASGPAIAADPACDDGLAAP